jgi:hypothetical protein
MNSHAPPPKKKGKRKISHLVTLAGEDVERGPKICDTIEE